MLEILISNDRSQGMNYFRTNTARASAARLTKLASEKDDGDVIVIPLVTSEPTSGASEVRAVF